MYVLVIIFFDVQFILLLLTTVNIHITVSEGFS